MSPLAPILGALLLAPLCLSLACADKNGDTGGPGDVGGDGGTDSGDGGSSCVGTAKGELPTGLTELAWDDGEGVTTLPEQGWSIGEYTLADEPLHEWVRFEAPTDLEVHAISVQLADLPDDPDDLVSVLLLDDFGYNGFDAWHPEPLWEGSLCAADIVEGAWATFVLDSPVSVSGGSLVYAGHFRAGEGEPALLLDGSTAGDGSCGSWSDCHSGFNLPDATTLTSGGYVYSYWQGYSTPFANDYMVRLHVAEAAPPTRARFAWSAEAPAGSRQAWGDFDNDGWDDLWLPGRLLRNIGEAEFQDVTDDSGITAMGIAASGGVWGDYDNDGCLDLFVFAESYTAGDSLLRNNCDGTFSDVTVEAGITDVQKVNTDCGGTASPTAGAAWWDIDSDGLLDLYLSNFICWDAYSYYTDEVWHNLGDGRFEAWTGERGFAATRMAGRGANPIDADRDGDVDLLVNNYVLQKNLYYDNLGPVGPDDDIAGDIVDEAAAELGLGGNATRTGNSYYYGHTIGTAWGDLDNDGDFDVVQANLAHPRFFDFSDKTQVLLNDGSGLFTDNAGAWEGPYSDNGLRYQETHSVPTLADLDADGVLDLAITAVYDGRPTDLYLGNGDGTFSPAWHGSGLDLTNGWGMSAGDVDNDGDIDLYTSGGLYLNQGEQGHWVQVRVVGDVASNRAAIGATVTVTDGSGQARIRHVQGGTGQGEQDSLTLHVGLGPVDTVDAISVTFPGGDTVDLAGPWAADQRLWLSESGMVHQGWDPPSWLTLR